MSCLHWGGGTEESSLTCSSDEDFTDVSVDAQWVFGRYATEAAAGWEVPAGLSGTDVCEMILQLTEAVGDIQATGYGGGPKLYYVSFYTLDGNYDLDTELCRSEAINGSNWNHTDVTWDGGDFDGGCDISSADVWIIYMDDDNNPDDFDIDGSNAAAILYDNEGGGKSVDRYFFSTAGASEGDGPSDDNDDPYMKLSTMQ